MNRPPSDAPLSLTARRAAYIAWNANNAAARAAYHDDTGTPCDTCNTNPRYRHYRHCGKCLYQARKARR